ncbi:MAG: hypothetical protein G01um101470_509 [Parcubacteria group bacterium Gr01-1014_70]|nr:MAG: hypothetical protein G01um101470_509 [Parcubacteria group bacterium Gr01-1014_70]
MSRNFKISAYLFASAVVVIAGMMFWFSGGQTDDDARRENQQSPQANNAAIKNNAGEQPKSGFFEVVKKPFQGVLEYFGGKMANEVVSEQKRAEEVSTLQKRLTENRLYTSRPLTDEEIFDRLWPPVYRQALLDTEKALIENGFLSADSRHDSLTKDEDIYHILLAMIDAAEKNEWISNSDADATRTGVRDLLPADIEAERKAYQKRTNVSSKHILPGDQRLTNSFLHSEDLIENLLEGLKYVFSINHAYAGWFTTPDCYKDDISHYPVPGFNSAIFCCNCGLFCTFSGCVRISDCGFHSVRCNVPLGCLNLQCRAWPNAIWDHTTRICGCG